MIDFHSHIIPGIDDGAKTVEESISMLKSCYEKGIRTIIASPHYYPKEREGLKVYLEKRDNAYKILKDACSGVEDIPRVLLGCEVNISSDVSEFEGIERLCIEGTEYIMLEIPHDETWNENLCDRIYNLKLKGLKPLMAHIDRYLPMPKKMMKDMADLEVLYQVNADAFLHFGIKKAIARLFSEGYVHVLGSDMHNLSNRDNNLDKALKELRLHFSDEHIKYLSENAEAIVKNEKPHLRWHRYLPEIGTWDLLFGRKKKKE